MGFIVKDGINRLNMYMLICVLDAFFLGQRLFFLLSFAHTQRPSTPYGSLYHSTMHTCNPAIPGAVGIADISMVPHIALVMLSSTELSGKKILYSQPQIVRT